MNSMKSILHSWFSGDKLEDAASSHLRDISTVEQLTAKFNDKLNLQSPQYLCIECLLPEIIELLAGLL